MQPGKLVPWIFFVIFTQACVSVQIDWNAPRTRKVALLSFVSGHSYLRSNYASATAKRKHSFCAESASINPIADALRLQASAGMTTSFNQSASIECSQDLPGDLSHTYCSEWPTPSPFWERVRPPPRTSSPPPPPLSRYGRESWAVALRALPQSRVCRRILPRLWANVALSLAVAVAFLAFPSLPKIGSHAHEVQSSFTASPPPSSSRSLYLYPLSPVSPPVTVSHIPALSISHTLCVVLVGPSTHA